MDCTVYYRRLYGLLRWTVQSAAGDCSNLPFKSPWPTAGNDLIFPLAAVKQQEAIQCDFYIISFQALASFPSSSFPGIHRCRKDALSLSCCRIHTPCSPARQGNHGHGIHDKRTVKVKQSLFQDIFCLHVEVIGRLIENQQIDRFKK